MERQPTHPTPPTFGETETDANYGLRDWANQLFHSSTTCMHAIHQPQPRRDPDKRAAASTRLHTLLLLVLLF